jgi:uncharacterized protein YjbI with pentapeptide repeats
LSYADLSNAYLVGVNAQRPDQLKMHRTNLMGAHLNSANLAGAYMAEAKLQNADLTGANLTEVDLSGALWSNTICPDGTNSDNDGGTCLGHLA